MPTPICAGIDWSRPWYATVAAAAARLDQHAVSAVPCLNRQALVLGLANQAGLPRNSGTITLKREEWTLPASLAMGDSNVIPLNAGETMQWKMV